MKRKRIAFVAFAWLTTLAVQYLLLERNQINQSSSIETNIETPSVESFDSELLLRYDQVQEDRRRRIRAVCKKSNEKSRQSKFTLQNVMIEETSKTIYCYLFKVAASSWMAFYLDTFGSEGLKERVAGTGAFIKILTELKGGKGI